MNANIATPKTTALSSSVYARALGPMFHRLAPVLTRLHGTDARNLWGTLRVRVNSRPPVRFLLWLARMPRANEAAACSIALIPHGDRERWHRAIGGRAFVTLHGVGENRTIVEHIGPFAVHLRLTIAHGGLWFRSYATTFLGVRLPRLFSMSIVGHERPIDRDAFYCAVRVRSPVLGPLIRYAGVLRFKTPSTGE